MRRFVISVVCALSSGALLMAAAAQADFPYAGAGKNKHDFTQLKVDQGEVPNDLAGDSNDWKFASTAEPNNIPVNLDERENKGVRGGSVADAHPGPPAMQADTAWTVTTGRPDVEIAVLDSGIKWGDYGNILDLRFKVHLNRGELPVPNHQRSTPVGLKAPEFTAPVNCGAYKNQYDANGDGIFNLLDYACDSRVNVSDPRRAGPGGVLTPQDLIIAFSDGKDGDANGFVDDIAGWDFLDNDNDPFDDVHYGHGTGEALDSSAEANNQFKVGNSTQADQSGACPNCMVLPLRVGDSFIADASRFGQAAIYAADNGVSVIQEALGTLNNTHLARAAVDYAYDHGVAVIASAADEAAQHHNYVSSLPHMIVVNSVNQYPGVPNFDQIPAEIPKSYLTFNGCTNFSSKITVAIPSSSCSSNATGVGAGIAGLIYSAALNARDQHKLAPRPGCTRTDGTPCPISANEVRQLMASGTFGAALNPDGTFDTTQVDDVNFLKNAGTGAPQSEPNCATKAAGCTDPNQALQQQVNLNRPILSPPNSQSYPARFGQDQFYGWGRVNAFKATNQVAQGHVPPEVEITSPDWFAQVDPTKPTAELKAQVWNRGSTYSCKVFVAPGSYPNNHLTSGDPLVGDFKQVASPVCNGSARTAAIDGVVAALDLNDLKSRFPADAGNFRGREPGQGMGQTSNGRPNSEPYGFTVRIVASTPAPGLGQVGASGEDRRQFQLHRDQDMLDGFPKVLPSDGASSPAFADLNGDNRNELVFATADGIVHAMRPDGTELPGWPVHGDLLPLHSGGRAFKTGDVATTTSRGSILASVAIGDLDRDGSLEVVAADMEGKIYAWDSKGHLLWKREANPAYSGKPLQPFVNVRMGERNRTQHGFIGSPVLADLDGNGTLEVVAANMDRHVYAWNASGAPLPGFPVLVVDLDKTKPNGGIDPTTHRVAFGSNAGDSELQGAIIDTPAVGHLTNSKLPDIVVGTNEEYPAKSLDPTNNLSSDPGDEGDTNAGATTATVAALSETGQLANANSRLYAIKPTGDKDGKPTTADWLEPGWPVKMAILEKGLLPIVGEGITGAPILGPVSCPFGGSGEKAAGFANTGVAYVLNPNGSSCLGDTAGRYNAMATDSGQNGGDHPAFPAVGHPAFADFGGNNGPVSLLAPVAGLNRALDVLFPEYQKGSQDLMAAWDPTTGQFRNGWPARMNDLQFITGPSVANVDASPGEELLAGSAYNDLQAFTGAGQPPNDHWPKLTSDWTVANPLIGTFGSIDTDPGARRVVVGMTRSGEILAYRTPAPPCEANAAHPLGSWPKFHHDLANSGDYSRDAVDPGVPYDIGTSQGNLTFKAPGDDLLCGKAAAYQVAEADFPLTGKTFFQGDQIPTTLKPAAPGTPQTLELGGTLERYLAIRAVDDQGNVGPIVTVSTAKKSLGGGGPGGGGLCGDRKAPGTTIERHPLKPGKHGLTVVGHADDGGCTKLSEAQRLNSILVSLSIARQVAHHKCRWLQPDNTFSRARSCKRPTNLRARGTYSLKKHKLVWTYHTPTHFSPGTYLVQAHAVDQSGNVEHRVTRLNRKVMKVPKPRRRRH